ncbi:WD40 repeat-like protein [Auricularia subglabra TFB-10046 SS5]|nr:WD40 repeat-like protein [Auricularia subglabra TFB-10046 SS5]
MNREHSQGSRRNSDSVIAAFCPTDATLLAIGGPYVLALVRSDDSGFRVVSAPLRPLEDTAYTCDAGSLAFSPDGGCIACGCINSTIQLWDVRVDEAYASTWSRFRRRVDSLATGFIPRLKSSSAEADGRRSREHIARLVLTGHSGPVHAVAFSRAGKDLISGSEDGSVRIWDISTGATVAVLQSNGPVHYLALSPDGSRIATGSDDCTVRVWDRVPPRKATIDTGYSGWIRSVAFSPDGGCIACGYSMSTVQLWDRSLASRGEQAPKLDLATNAGPVYDLAFSPAGKHIISGSSDGSVHIWDISTGTAVGVLRARTGTSRSLHHMPVAISPDASRIATGSDYRTVRVWDRVPVDTTARPDSRFDELATSIED